MKDDGFEEVEFVELEEELLGRLRELATTFVDCNCDTASEKACFRYFSTIET